ncbi:biotin--[acetyl-CoA-carboxylase] ligase [Conyzicola nivalis]|uniref:biotin--[biotin carboxyl-carrier protein] ligase n=1 Tax=Conyzicola nivalis TaxID=1477021 RepID=A0A916WI59_9MICO|nr:biotin--[acetyl-CoA-carboxylase] ligase [Conyzicola nivalis]GGB03687.1 biotin--[acetyl-CoA-carboxylase] ligase [Conyzicola nivalis]
MKLPLSAAAVDHLEILPEAGSTNDELVARAGTLGDFSVVVTGSQTAGRGRLGRVWVAPPGASLAISVLLRPVLPGGEPLELRHFGWLPLIAGIAMTRTVQSLLPEHRVGLKWPNDVQVDGLKISGLLAELLPAGDAVVMGAGLNLSLTRDQLPTPVSTSLDLSGATLSGDDLADAALSAYLLNLRELYTGFVRVGADPVGSGVAEQLTELCTTIGQQVKVELPGAPDLVGTAVGIDGSGRLRVRGSLDGHVTAVAAGDVTHLRYE